MLAVLLLATLSPVGDREIAPMPREKKVPMRLVYERPFDYEGEVMAVSKSSITVRGRDTCDRVGPDIIREFAAGKHLAKGEQDPDESVNSDYRLSDVKKGDKVHLVLRASGDDDLCLAIRIMRRPGGEVPPAPFEPSDVPHKYHLDMNAYQAHEERGIPLPPRLDPEYQRWQDKLREKALMEFIRKQDHTAPPPRPVIRR